METKEVNDFRNTKPHKDKEWLAKAWSEGKEAGEIANELNISTKLVHILLKEYGIA